MNLAGYIKLHRKMMNWRWKNHPPTLCLFIHLLLSASYETERTGGLILNPGQVVVSLNSLSKETGLTVDQIRTALSHLQKTGEIVLETSKGCRSTLVTIQNWARYQIAQSDSQSSEAPETQTPQGFSGSHNFGNPKVVPEVETSQSFSQSFSQGQSQSDSQSSKTPETRQGNGLQPQAEEQPQSTSQSDSQSESQSNSQTISNKKTKKEKNIKKNKYGDFVLLTEDEYKKLIAVFGLPFTTKAIEVLDNYIGSKGDKYKSHYYTIRGWVKDAVQRDYHLRPQPEATTTDKASGNTSSPEVDPLAEWGGSL